MIPASSRFRAGGDGSRILTYLDPQDQSPLRTVWLADDFPHLRQPDQPQTIAGSRPRVAGALPLA
jgi:hypothetical protein